MKRIILLFTLIFSLFTVTFAKTRTTQEANQTARTFLNQTKNSLQRAPSASNSIQLAYTCVDKKATLNNTLYYVYNVAEKDGFVIVSGDDRAKDILGYSDTGNFDINTIPDNLKYWLSCYANEIQNLPTEVSKSIPYNNSTFSNTNTKVGESFLLSVNPLLGDIKWNQGAPYNNLCPAIDTNTGEKAATGCVATGMAQVMRFHKWPVKGNGSNTYITEKLKIPLSLDFSETTFDWDNMAGTYDGTSTEIQKNAVATLMYNCGVSVNMDYNKSSGALSSNMANALKTNFGYDTNIQYNQRDYYNREEWKTLLKIELNASRPVLYRGQTNDGAHLFVCDGYDSNDLFHFNWGWGGSSNGYFVISALNPNEQGIGGSVGGFDTHQAIITGVQKPNIASVPSYLICNDLPMSVPVQSVPRASSFDITLNQLFNKGINTFTGSIGIALYNTEGLIQIVSSVNVNELSFNRGWYTFKMTSKLPTGTLNGDYKIYAVCKAKNESSWHIVRGLVGTPNFTNITVDTEKINFKQPTDVAPVLKLNSFTVTGKLYKDKKGRFNVSVTNTGGEYNSVLGIYLQSTVDDAIYQMVTTETVNIASGETRDLLLTGIVTMEPGEYALTTEYDPGNNSSIASETRTLGIAQTINVFEASTDVPALTLTNPISFPNPASVYKGNALLSANIKNTSGIFENKVIAFIFPSTPGGSIAYLGYQDLFLDTNEEKTITFGGSIDLEPGQYRVGVYFFNASAKWSKITPNDYSLINFTLVDIQTGTNQLKESHFDIYPNPVKDNLQLRANDIVKQIVITDILGKRIMLYSPNNENMVSIPVSNLKQGTYFIRVETNSESKTLKFIKD